MSESQFKQPKVNMMELDDIIGSVREHITEEDNLDRNPKNIYFFHFCRSFFVHVIVFVYVLCTCPFQFWSNQYQSIFKFLYEARPKTLPNDNLSVFKVKCLTIFHIFMVDIIISLVLGPILMIIFMLFGDRKIDSIYEISRVSCMNGYGQLTSLYLALNNKRGDDSNSKNKIVCKSNFNKKYYFDLFKKYDIPHPLTTFIYYDEMSKLSKWSQVENNDSDCDFDSITWYSNNNNNSMIVKELAYALGIGQYMWQMVDFDKKLYKQFAFKQSRFPMTHRVVVNESKLLNKNELKQWIEKVTCQTGLDYCIQPFLKYKNSKYVYLLQLTTICLNEINDYNLNKHDNNNNNNNLDSLVVEPLFGVILVSSDTWTSHSWGYDILLSKTGEILGLTNDYYNEFNDERVKLKPNDSRRIESLFDKKLLDKTEFNNVYNKKIYENAINCAIKAHKAMCIESKNRLTSAARCWDVLLIGKDDGDDDNDNDNNMGFVFLEGSMFDMRCQYYVFDSWKSVRALFKLFNLDIYYMAKKSIIFILLIIVIVKLQYNFV